MLLPGKVEKQRKQKLFKSTSNSSKLESRRHFYWPEYKKISKSNSSSKGEVKVNSNGSDKFSDDRGKVVAISGGKRSRDSKCFKYLGLDT